jgi:hypothetical protein
LRLLIILELTKALLIIDKDYKNLLVDELLDTIDKDYISSEILGLCRLLLETRKIILEQDLGLIIIYLVYFSVKQYILYNIPAQEGLLITDIRLRASNKTLQNNILAKLCFCYLNFQNITQESY